MIKITFLGAGSTVFAKTLLGDVMLRECLHEVEIALYDIDAVRLEESYILIRALNENINGGRARIRKYLGTAERKEALRGARFVVNAIQVGGYEPCTVIDFEIPKKYGVYQTIGDTIGIGGIFRALRTIVVMRDFARDMEEVCPDALLLNYTNPMAMLTGYMLRHTGVRTVGLCHSVQVCTKWLLVRLGMEDKLEGRREKIAGINHMGWLLEIEDRDGNDLYPEIRRRAAAMNRTEKHRNMVRFDYIEKFGYYCTESSEHNAEYSALYIKRDRPDVIERYNIPLDEYPRRCIKQIETWEEQRDGLLAGGKVTHEPSHEYAARIMDAILTDRPERIGGNVINNGLIENLPREACVEVPCLVDSKGIHPTHVGRLPIQLAAMNMTNINPQLLTIEAAATGKMEHVYHAAMLDPHTGAILTTDECVALCDELRAAHEAAGFPIF